jgi:hypothetical protein
MFTHEELVAGAGVDPWALRDKLRSGNPAQIEELASAFYRAGGDMADAHSTAVRAQDFVRAGYQVQGSSPLDYNGETAKYLATMHDSATKLPQIGKLLVSIATELDGHTGSANGEVAALESEVAGSYADYQTYLNTGGHHDTVDDQRLVRAECLAKAVAAVRSRGGTVKGLVSHYESDLHAALKQMADLGYLPPDAVDEGPGDIDPVKLATDLADQLKNDNSGNSDFTRHAHDIALQAAPYMNDPVFAAAFYGELGPLRSQTLPALINDAGGSPTADEDMKVFSHMFGTAITHSDLDPRLAEIKNDFLKPPPYAGLSWDRAAMVSNGDFPPDWLARAADANALDQLAAGKDFPGGRWDGGPGFQGAATYGLPSDVAGAWLHDLGQNPQAARQAITDMGGPDHGHDLAQNVHLIIDHGRHIDGVPAAYGEAFAAATGANDEVDGHHSAAASQFAVAVFNDLGRDSGVVQPAASSSFAKIAGSYVLEMAAGYQADGNSVIEGVPGGGDALTGVPAGFEIPPELSKHIMQTFVGDGTATGIFDQAAGRASHQALLDAARADANTPADSADHMERTAEAFGTVAGTENSAQLEHYHGQVESEESLRRKVSWLVDLIPGEKVAEKVPGTLWDLGKHLTNIGLENNYGADPQSHLDKLGGTAHDLALTSLYERTSILQEAGYPGTDRIPPELLDHGHLRDVGQVLGDPALKAKFDDYLNGTAREHGHPGYVTVYDEVHRSANAYLGGFDRANEPPGHE